MTANAILEAQKSKHPGGNNEITQVQLSILREQDFGSLECKSCSLRKTDSGTQEMAKPQDMGFQPKETLEAMTERADTFLEQYIAPALATDKEHEHTVAVVSHGLILGVLWKALLLRFASQSISLGPEVSLKAARRPIENLPGWSNTGYLDLSILPHGRTAVLTHDKAGATQTKSVMTFTGWKMVIEAVNSKQHLRSLKRTRGGVGSSTYDPKQKSLESFFKQPKAQPAE